MNYALIRQMVIFFSLTFKDKGLAILIDDSRKPLSALD